MMEESSAPANNTVEKETGLRTNLIDTAVRFLENPSVIHRPLKHKQHFLKEKGLTDEELRIACERAGAFTVAAHQQPIVNAVLPLPNQHHVLATQPSFLAWIRDIIHTLALLGGVGYAVYWVYKTYIKPFLFGPPKPKKSTEESLSELEKAVGEVHRSTSEFRTEIRSELGRIVNERESATTRKLTDLKADIAIVKGLLLSRQQFPSAPSNAGLRSAQTSKPSIPSWQMSSDELDTKQETETDPQSQERDLNSENPSVGSGELPPNGSDSSLEMIQE